jgi:hypothetical protein
MPRGSPLQQLRLVPSVSHFPCGSRLPAALARRRQREGLHEVEELSFNFRRQRFVYDAASHTFEKLRFPDKARAARRPGSQGAVRQRSQRAYLHVARRAASWHICIHMHIDAYVVCTLV